MKLAKASPWEYVIDGLIRPLVEAYFALLKECGLQLEPHAQNILFSLDRNYYPKSVIARDAESIDKDFGLMQTRNLSLELTEIEYGRLHPKDYNYQILHSLMFDFKMGEYLLEPLVEWLVRNSGIERGHVYREIRKITKEHLVELPNDFLPLSMWYSYAKVVNDRTKQREYVKNSVLKFR